MTTALREHFHHHFDVRSDIGSDPELMTAALKLRYQVYCIEHPYEDAAAFPDHMERDSHDPRSLHSLLIHRESCLVAGTVRLIRPDPDNPVGSLPIDGLCRDPRLADEGLLPRATLAEISRFAISKELRRRAADAQAPSGLGAAWTEGDPGDRRQIPHLCLGLLEAMVCCSFLHGITHWVAEMEPPLLRLLAGLGLHWNKLGPIVEFHGRRQPCYTDISEHLARARRERPDVWDLLTNGGLWAAPATCRALETKDQDGVRAPVPEPVPAVA